MGHIQTLSLADYLAGGMRRSRFLVALDDSWHASGFVIITDTGINPDAAMQTLRATNLFFSLPEAVKYHYEDVDGGRQRGVTRLGGENAAHEKSGQVNRVEFWHQGRELSVDHPYLPSYRPNLHVTEGDFATVVPAMYQEFDDFASRINPAISELFEMHSGWMNQLSFEGDSILRLLHYPAVGDEVIKDGVVNVGHTDIDLYACVIAGSDGLEVWIEDRWVPIDAPPGAVIMNAGDMMQLLSGGYYPSAWHRVITRDRKTKRLSMAFFFHPPRSTVLRPSGRFAKNADALWQRRICTAGWLLFHRLREINLFHGENPFAHEGTDPALFPAPQRPGVWTA